MYSDTIARRISTYFLSIEIEVKQIRKIYATMFHMDMQRKKYIISNKNGTGK